MPTKTNANSAIDDVITSIAVARNSIANTYAVDATDDPEIRSLLQLAQGQLAQAERNLRLARDLISPPQPVSELRVLTEAVADALGHVIKGRRLAETATYQVDRLSRDHWNHDDVDDHPRHLPRTDVPPNRRHHERISTAVQAAETYLAEADETLRICRDLAHNPVPYNYTTPFARRAHGLDELELPERDI